MKIVAIIADGAGHVHLRATRSPDLLRRQIAAETGHARLISACLAPDGLGPQPLIDSAALRLQDCRIGPGLYAAPPTVVVRAVARACRVHRLQRSVASMVRRTLRRYRTAVRRLPRITAQNVPS